MPPLRLTFHNSYARPLKFALVGAVNTAIDIAVFAVLYRLLETHVLVANTLAFSVAVTNSYVMNRLWTFSSSVASHPERKAFLFYVAISLGGLVISNTIVYALIGTLHWLATKLLAVFATFVWNYLLTSRLLFKDLK
ncbi:MAG: GtrA family protein [Gammaproteobacteria bacterium]|nr:GtrA family protein [Gammaproteobacteria bacterium]